MVREINFFNFCNNYWWSELLFGIESLHNKEKNISTVSVHKFNIQLVDIWLLKLLVKIVRGMSWFDRTREQIFSQGLVEQFFIKPFQFSFILFAKHNHHSATVLWDALHSWLKNCIIECVICLWISMVDFNQIFKQSDLTLFLLPVTT